MFGFRADGKLVRNLDPFDKIIPYIMPERVDSQVFTEQYIDYDALLRYCHEQKAKGHDLSVMAVFIAAMVRLYSQRPELNRFVVNKRIYARKHLCVSFVVLKPATEGRSYAPTTTKVYFDPHDTVYQVAERLEAAVADARKTTEKNATDALASALMNIPLLPGFAVKLVIWLDKLGLLPSAVLHASPFHTSLFLANMASVRMGHNYHHIYNFGTTSIFCSMGMMEKKVDLDPAGTPRARKMIPLGITTDERSCSGSQYSAAFAQLKGILKDPSVLETPPQSVRFDGVEYSIPAKYAK